MTRKELITACIDDQVKRGIIKEEDREMQIKKRLVGAFAMGKADCERWYNTVFGGERK